MGQLYQSGRRRQGECRLLACGGGGGGVSVFIVVVDDIIVVVCFRARPKLCCNVPGSRVCTRMSIHLSTLKGR